MKYTTITNVFLRCHSHSASGGLKQKPYNNCQITRIVTNFLIFFLPTRYNNFTQDITLVGNICHSVFLNLNIVSLYFIYVFIYYLIIYKYHITPWLLLYTFKLTQQPNGCYSRTKRIINVVSFFPAFNMKSFDRRFVTTSIYASNIIEERKLMTSLHINCHKHLRRL